MAILLIEDEPNWYQKPEADTSERLGRTIEHAEALAQTINGEDFHTLNTAIKSRVLDLLSTLLTSIRVDWQELEEARIAERKAKAA
ncbi:MAG: hypothetical protein QM769_12065 [Pseudoxanthomonas sp.]